MEAIRENFPQDVYKSFCGVLKSWLTQNYTVIRHGPPTWQALVKAVDGINHALAVKIARSHPKQSPQPRG